MAPRLSPLTGGFSCASPARRRRALTAPSGGDCQSITAPNTLPDIVLLFPPISPVNSRETRGYLSPHARSACHRPWIANQRTMEMDRMPEDQELISEIRRRLRVLPKGAI